MSMASLPRKTEAFNPNAGSFQGTDGERPVHYAATNRGVHNSFRRLCSTTVDLNSQQQSVGIENAGSQ